MVKKKSNSSVFHDKEKMSYVFLGVGLSLFFLNISAMMSYNPVKYSYYAFDISIFSSIIIVLYTVYVIHYTKEVKNEKRHF